ncbi:MAG: class I adenylate-forming enzyme family protein [Hyphomicrobiaceae bacterium]
MTTTILSLLSADLLGEYYRRGWWRDETVYGAAARHAAAMPDRPAFRDRYRRLSWKTLVERADALSLEFRRRGLKRGNRVAFWMPDRIESVIVMLACSRSGYVVCPSPHRNHTVEEVRTMVSRMRAAAFLHQPGFGSDAGGRDVAGMIGELAHVRASYALPSAGPKDAGRLPFDGIVGATDRVEGLQPPERNPDRVSYLAFTSGSTGEPKGVMHSDNTLLVTARALTRDWRIGPDSAIYSMSPYSHNLGIGALLTAVNSGAETVIHDTPRGQSIVDRLVETGVTYLVGVPTHAIDLIAELKRRGMDRLGRVTGFRVSGAACPPEVKLGLMELGITPQSGYGMTENNSHQYTHPDDERRLILETCGRACEGYEIRIFDPENTDRELARGEIGLVAGRGASLMLGYFDNQRATEESFNEHGWFLTGDLGRLTPEGYLQLTGRRKEVIIRGGHNINPSRIEEMAMGHPAIARAAALSVPDERLGERICIAYALEPGAALDIAGLLAYLADGGLSRYEMPEFRIEISDMPLMANGKIDKPVISGWIRSGKIVPEPCPHT